MINEDEIINLITQEEENKKETKIEKKIKRDLARVKQAEKRASEKKVKENGLSTTVRFYNVDDVARLLKLKKNLAGKNIALSSYLSEMISLQLANEEKEIVLKDIKNDLFYSFRKSFYASLSPFQHNIINEINKVEDEVEILNEKMDLLLQAMSGNAITSQDLDAISKHKEELKLAREKAKHKREKLDEARDKRLSNFQAYDTKQEFDSNIYKDEIDDEFFEE
ncbi:Mbov_0398 family ICE element protein [Mycoplasma sp. VS30B]